MTDIKPPALTGIGRPIDLNGASSRAATAGSRSDATLQANDSQLQTACAGMESLFLNHLMQKMRATIETSDLFGGGQTEKLYTSMLDAEIARTLAASGGIGLARILQQQLSAADSSTPGTLETEGERSSQPPGQPNRPASKTNAEIRLK
jgi:Rod binding domain-containing protein